MIAISDLEPGDSDSILAVASILLKGFLETAPGAWPDLETALEEVHESLGDDRISRIARQENEVVGWIGGIDEEYDGGVWELHPLVVAPEHQRRGIGRLLVFDFETQVQAREGNIITLGTDDMTGQTSLAGIDLFQNTLEHLSRIRNLNNHPYEFYQKLGYTITGVIPDANGWGKPDILMAKHL